MFEFIKKNKFIITVTSILVLIVVVSFLGHRKPSHRNTLKAPTPPQIEDTATGDNTAESLNALTQELHQVIRSNQQLQANNAALNKKNANILRNIREEVQQNLEKELQKHGQDNQAKIAQLQKQLTTVNGALKKIINHQTSETKSTYPVDGQGGQELTGRQVVYVNGQRLVAIPDISGLHVNTNQENSIDNEVTVSSPDSLLHSNALDNAAQVSKQKEPKPYYTVPSGATLARSISMTALIGRVPVNGVVKSPYPFKMIIGANNMAANGLHIPGINGAIVQGYTVGDMALNCVKGYVTAITFIFPDGTVSTTSMNSSSTDSDLGFNNSLGYISEPNGNPCFSGKFYTNAPKYLATMMALGALNQGGQAYALAQQTAMSNALGGTTTSLTGSVGKYMLGGAVQGGTQQAMDWFTEREKNSFDAVYVPAGKKAVINITKQIDINYNPNGRKIYYERAKNRQNNTSLD